MARIMAFESRSSPLILAVGSKCPIFTNLSVTPLSLHFRPARVGRNPKSGDKLGLRSTFVPHFKPGKELRERVNLKRGKTTHSVASPTTDSAPSVSLILADHHSEQSQPA